MNYGFFRIFAKIVIIWGVSGGALSEVQKEKANFLLQFARLFVPL